MTEADPRRFWERPLSLVGWVVGLAIVSAWMLARILAGVTQRDQFQQYALVQYLARFHLHDALGVGMQPQTSPPGYALFALPFHAALQRFTPDETGFLLAGWVALACLAAAGLVLLREVGVPRRSPLELLGVGAIAGSNATLACYGEAYHAADVLAAALVCVGAVAALRHRWAVAALALGGGLACRQWVVVAIAVLAILVHGRARLWLIAGPFGVAALVLLPFFATGPKATMQAIEASGISPTYRSIISHWGWLFAHQHILLFEVRYLPLLLTAVLCVWLSGRRAPLTPAIVVAALALAMLARPLVDPAGFVYYLAPGMVFAAACRPGWGWPVAVIASSVAYDVLSTSALHSRSAWTAATAEAVVLAVAIAIALHLRASIRFAQAACESS